MHDFVTSFFGHLENIGSLNYEDLSSTDTFNNTTSKNILLNHWSHQKSLMLYWNDGKLMVVYSSFQKF